MIEKESLLFLKSHSTLFHWVYIFHCTFNMKMTLIVKIHRYWQFMSDSDTIWIHLCYIPLCKSSHSQCDAYTADESTTQINHIFYTYFSIYKINLYTHWWFHIYSVQIKLNETGLYIDTEWAKLGTVCVY